MPPFNIFPEIHDRMEQTVLRQQGHHFDALVGSLIEDC